MGLARAIRTAGALAVLTGAACQLPAIGGGSTPPTPAQTVTTALHGFETAWSVRVQGDITFGDDRYTINLSIDRSANVDGLVVPGKAGPLSVAGTSRGLLLRGARYFQDVRKVYTGTRWVLAPDDAVSSLVGLVQDRATFAKVVRDAIGGDLGREQGKEPDGTKTVTFVGTHSGVRLTIPAAGTPLPLRLITPPGHPLSNGVADMSLSMAEYGKTVAPPEPDKFVNMADRDTLPVDVVVDGKFSWDDCDSGGCTMSEDVRNTGGRDGTATATFNVSTDTAGKQIVASCSVTIPVLGNGQTTRVGCRANYDRSVEHWGSISITNPSA